MRNVCLNTVEKRIQILRDTGFQVTYQVENETISTQSCFMYRFRL